MLFQYCFRVVFQYNCCIMFTKFFNNLRAQLSTWFFISFGLVKFQAFGAVPTKKDATAKAKMHAMATPNGR